MVLLEGNSVIALSAAIAVTAGAIGTAYVQSHVGSAAMGLLAEKENAGSQVLILMALPETLVLLGFIIAFLMVQKIAGA